MARPIFHFLFGSKWDPSIVLFQLLAFRGIFVVLNSLYNNYLLAKGEAGVIMKMEILRDTVALIALFVALPFVGLSTPDNPVLGLEYLLWGQVAATVLTWIVTLVITCRVVGASKRVFLYDLVPYAAQVALLAPVMAFCGHICPWAGGQVLIELIVGAGLYLLINHLAGSKIQGEVIRELLGRNKESVTT